MNIQELATKLWEANRQKKTIPALRSLIGLEDLEQAYAIQNINTNRKLVNGARITGKKIGLTSIAVQKQLGVDQPDFGMLFNDMEVLNGLSMPYAELMQPKVEAEIAFVLKEDLDRPDLNIVDIINAMDYALPAIEIVGSRIENWDIKITDTIADNASASHYVLGHQPKPLSSFDVVNCEMIMVRNGEIVSEGTGAACMGSPLNAVLWLANKMVAMKQPLRAGEVILSGALGPMAGVAQGDSFSATFQGLGSVSITFE